MLFFAATEEALRSGRCSIRRVISSAAKRRPPSGNRAGTSTATAGRAFRWSLPSTRFVFRAPDPSGFQADGRVETRSGDLVVVNGLGILGASLLGRGFRREELNKRGQLDRIAGLREPQSLFRIAGNLLVRLGRVQGFEQLGVGVAHFDPCLENAGGIPGTQTGKRVPLGLDLGLKASTRVKRRNEP